MYKLGNCFATLVIFVITVCFSPAIVTTLFYIKQLQLFHITNELLANIGKIVNNVIIKSLDMICGS